MRPHIQKRHHRLNIWTQDSWLGLYYKAWLEFTGCSYPLCSTKETRVPSSGGGQASGSWQAGPQSMKCTGTQGVLGAKTSVQSTESVAWRLRDSHFPDKNPGFESPRPLAFGNSQKKEKRTAPPPPPSQNLSSCQPGRVSRSISSELNSPTQKTAAKRWS